MPLMALCFTATSTATAATLLHSLPACFSVNQNLINARRVCTARHSIIILGAIMIGTCTRPHSVQADLSVSDRTQSVAGASAQSPPQALRFGHYLKFSVKWTFKVPPLHHLLQIASTSSKQIDRKGKRWWYFAMQMNNRHWCVSGQWEISEIKAQN